MTARSGFTLIETLIYIALVGVLVGGGVAAAFYIIDTSGKNRTDVSVQAEGLFLLRKIDWVIMGVTAVAEPAPGTTATALEVTKTGVGTIRVDAASEQARISVNGAPAVALTNDRVHIQYLQFTRTTEAGKPDRLDTTITIDGKTFSFSKYVRP